VAFVGALEKDSLGRRRSYYSQRSLNAGGSNLCPTKGSD
jgi:hypothetical protein